jgi:hypothetical protein
MPMRVEKRLQIGFLRASNRESVDSPRRGLFGS